MADREPIGASGRPTGEMPVTNARSATPHSTHDLVLLAAAADRDVDPALRSAAATQAASCVDCAAIAADLRALADGLAGLPETRTAPRDMRLSVEQAAKLRRGRLWRTLLRPFGASGFPALRPLAATLTTLGLAGLLITAIPAGLGLAGLGSSGAALAPAGNTVDNTTSQAGKGTVQPVPAVGPYASGAAPEFGGSSAGAGSLDAASAAPSSRYSAYTGQPATSAAAQGIGTPKSTVFSDAGPVRSVSPLALVSIALLVVGLALFALRIVARRAG